MQKPKTAYLRIRLHEQTRAKIEELAAAEYRTMTNMVEMLIERAHDQYKQGQAPSK